MKIDSNFEPQAGQGPTGAGAAGGTGATQDARYSQTSQSGTTDKAEFSSDAQMFAKLSGQVSSAPDVRQDRVASLKQAVQNGTYNVSNQQIAQAMARDLGNK